MNLYLVQHAEAKSKEEDPERSLSEIGLANVRKIAAFASENIDIRLGRILHSGKTRAAQTAQILAKYLKPEEGIDASKGLLPADDPIIWSERLKKEKDDIMLVGHLPHMQRLASVLICNDADNITVRFRNAGIVCLIDDEAGKWAVRWILLPDMLK